MKIPPNLDELWHFHRFPTSAQSMRNQINEIKGVYVCTRGIAIIFSSINTLKRRTLNVCRITESFPPHCLQSRLLNVTVILQDAYQNSNKKKFIIRDIRCYLSVKEMSYFHLSATFLYFNLETMIFFSLSFSCVCVCVPIQLARLLVVFYSKFSFCCCLLSTFLLDL